MEEENEGDISPRTLAAAVARLAAYTSEEPVGESLCYGRPGSKAAEC